MSEAEPAAYSATDTATDSAELAAIAEMVAATEWATLLEVFWDERKEAFISHCQLKDCDDIKLYLRAMVDTKLCSVPGFAQTLGLFARRLLLAHPSDMCEV